MKIVSVVDRELTREEVDSIKRFRQYTDGVSFACLRERVMIMLEEDDATNVDKLKEAALCQMQEALCTHPDFTVYNMDDGHVLLVMPSGLAAFTDHPAIDTMMLNLCLRGECLDAAEKGEIIAVAYEDEEDISSEDEYEYKDDEEEN